jgi:23S rRNA (cytosine1962-C5)-methyltransferase
MVAARSGKRRVRERIITREELAKLEAEGTTAHRIWTTYDSWVERFAEDYLISSPGLDEGRDIAAKLPEWLGGLGLSARRVFVRRLVKQPGAEDKPEQISGPDLSPETVVHEHGLRFGIDFSAGYSAGLFCDQRDNRAHLETLRPRRVLNCFAYTCAFSVAAARTGAETLSLDLSKKSLDRGRANFALNDFPLDPHRFIADDVFGVLPRLARRGERFDAIVLDPPTFSRGAKGNVFRVERDFPRLIDLALDLAEPGAWLLLSTNSREMDVNALHALAGRRRIHAVPPPPEYPSGSASATLWIAAG